MVPVMKILNRVPCSRGRAIRWLSPALLIPLLVALSGCQSVRSAAERFGVDRRDALVESLDKTDQGLLEVHQSFSNAKTELDEFAGQYEIPLRERHERLSEQYVSCEEALDDARVEIRDLEDAARQFFLDWETELFEYSNPTVRNASRLQLNETREKYETVAVRLKKAEEVALATLDEFRDYLSFMRHNLNDEAFAALREPGVDLSSRMADLLTELAAAVDASHRLAEALRVH